MSRAARRVDLSVRLLFPGVLVIYLLGFLRSIAGRSTIVAGYPRVLLVCVAVLLGIATAVEFRDFRRGERPLITRVSRDALPDNWWRAPVTALSLVALFVLADVVGFHTASAVFIAGLMLVMGERHLGKVVAVTGGVVLSSYWLFSVLFRLRLPEGWLL